MYPYICLIQNSLIQNSKLTMPQTAPKKARRAKIYALIISAIVVITYYVFIWNIQHTNIQAYYILLLIGLLVGYSTFRLLTAKFRKRDAILKQTFPPKWRILLQENVAFYNALSPAEKIKFEQNVQVFLVEKRITGIKTEIDDKIRLLVAASAIIPIFGFDEWEYDNLGEVLIYPAAFTKDFEQEGKGRNVLGMVGTGAMNGIMILSKRALVEGFMNPQDGRNVGIHEFIHLIDAKDGDYDGIPSLQAHQFSAPWMDMIYKEMKKIVSGKSKIDDYGATNKVEFFAVASEYFFEKPAQMKRDNPALYKMLSRIFNQDLTHRFTSTVKDMMGFTGKKVGRNSPCPCGSGKKYKRCCL